jgi:signal-transduction protein with cAMP-binding, CBS, and nucleotidyltransferase domain
VFKLASPKETPGTFIVEAIMRTPPVVVKAWTSASETIDRMITRNVGSVIVVDDKRRPLGIITEKDVLERVFKANRDPATTPSREVMSSPILTVEHTTSLEDALTRMRREKVRRLAVTEKGTLVGQLTERRILTALSVTSEPE